MSKRIYIGPKQKGLHPNTIFDGVKFPPHVAKLVEEKPAILKLMVSPEQLQEAKSRIKTAGDPLHKFYFQIRS